VAGKPGPRAQFCPESNDLLYPKEDRERRVLIFQCQNCDYKEDADPADWCVYRCGRKSCRPDLPCAAAGLARVWMLGPAHADHTRSIKYACALVFAHSSTLVASQGKLCLASGDERRSCKAWLTGSSLRRGLAAVHGSAQRAAAPRRNEITHSHKEKTVVLQDVSADPTLPRTRDVMCQKCQHNEAVFFSAATEEVWPVWGGVPVWSGATMSEPARLHPPWRDNMLARRVRRLSWVHCMRYRHLGG